MSGLTFEGEKILNAVSDGITINSQGILLYVNKPFAQMVGYQTSELLGMNIMDVTAPEYQNIVEERTRNRQEGHEAEPIYEVELIRKNGARIPVEYSVSRIDYQGKSSSLTIIRDISERKYSHLYYTPVFSLLNEAIVIFDTEKYLWANEAYLSLRGYDSPEEIMGTSIFSGIHPEEAQENVRVISERVRTRESTKGTWRLRKRDGSYRWVIAHSSVLPYQESTITVAIIRPVESSHEEEPIVNIAGFKNEINTALTIIMGYIELIETQEKLLPNSKISKWLDIIIQNLNRIEGTINR